MDTLFKILADKGRSTPDRAFIEEQQPTILCVECSDSRYCSSDALVDKLGMKFVCASNVMGAIQPHENYDKSLKAAMSFALLYLRSIEIFIILGHTHCGGIATMRECILFENHNHSDEIVAWVEPMITKDLKNAVTEAERRGKSADAVLRQMEKYTVLQSSINALDYKLKKDNKEIKLRNVINELDIHIYPSIFDVKSHKLRPFLPKMQDFVHAEEIEVMHEEIPDLLEYLGAEKMVESFAVCQNKILETLIT